MNFFGAVRVPPAPGSPLCTPLDAARWLLYAKKGKPPGTKRLATNVSVLVAVLACTPVWWWLTSVHRSPLPLGLLHSLPRVGSPVLRLHVVLVTNSSVEQPLEAAQRVLAAASEAVEQARTSLDFLVSASAHTSLGCAAGEAVPSFGHDRRAPPQPDWACGSLAAVHKGEAARSLLRAAPAHAAGAYTLLLLPGASPLEVGHRRWAWAGADGCAAAAAAFAALLSHTPAFPVSLLSPVGRLSVEAALVNADAGAGGARSWGHAAWSRAGVLGARASRLAAALSPALSLSFRSSVLLGAGMGCASRRVSGEGGDSRWEVAIGDAHTCALPSWPLPAPPGHGPHFTLVALVAPQRARPLFLAGNAPGWAIPGWGAVALLPEPNGSSSHAVSDAELNALWWVWVAQLRGELRLPPPRSASAAHPSGVADWEGDALGRAACAACAAEAGAALGSLARVAGSVRRAPVPRAAAAAAARAVAALASARDHAAAGRHFEAWRAAGGARLHAHAAASYDALLPPTHFPPHHSLAVYLPLFLPALLPILLASIREAKHYRRRAAFAAAWHKHAKT